MSGLKAGTLGLLALTLGVFVGWQLTPPRAEGAEQEGAASDLQLQDDKDGRRIVNTSSETSYILAPHQQIDDVWHWTAEGATFLEPHGEVSLGRLSGTHAVFEITPVGEFIDVPGAISPDCSCADVICPCPPSNCPCPPPPKMEVSRYGRLLRIAVEELPGS